jgi:hypothetical protein
MVGNRETSMPTIKPQRQQFDVNVKPWNKYP